MGLDVFAASHLKYSRPIPRGKAFDRLEEEAGAKGKEIDEVYFFLSPNLPVHRARLGGMKTGLYAYTAKSRRFGFRAGSYGYYSWWRNELSLFALDVEAEDVWFDARSFRGRPFYELIDFTDCDGRMGTNVCAKLAANFTVYAARAKRHAATVTDPDYPDDPDVGAGWLQTYRDFARAVRLAARGGALTFS